MSLDDCPYVSWGRVGLVVTVLAVMITSGTVLGVSDDESSDLGLTLQNQRIMCWGTSYTQGESALHGQGEGYPEHLGRILGRDVDMHPTMAGSEGFLKEVSMFEGSEGGEYGLIVLQSSWDYLLGISWGITETNTRQIIRRLKATGAVVVFWEDAPLWEIDGQMTTTKDWYDIWGAHGCPYGIIDDETQTAAYCKAWGGTLYQKVCDEEDALFIPHSAFHDCIEPGCPARTIIHPELMDTDGKHLNGIGYVVLAERFARYLVDWGLAEYAETHEEISQGVTALLLNATNIITELTQQGMKAENLDDLDDLAQLLSEHQYLYSARWQLRNEAIPLLERTLSRWPEISAMFANASRHIEAAAQAGMDTETMERDYGYAEDLWSELDYGVTKWYLQGILDTEIPEPALLPFLALLGLILLPLLRDRRMTACSAGVPSLL